MLGSARNPGTDSSPWQDAGSSGLDELCSTGRRDGSVIVSNEPETELERRAREG
ncbi:MAG: hypothetical protein OES32_06400 [Acidobacteriota bacterium]|nr:hypothetical protein [Acidobacteriota bacterium]MDH3523199.1 hypothetical protein [Acidobacteriota bacterium]